MMPLVGILRGLQLICRVRQTCQVHGTTVHSAMIICSVRHRGLRRLLEADNARFLRAVSEDDGYIEHLNLEDYH